MAKGVTVEDTDTFRSYADKIANIQSGGGKWVAPNIISFNGSSMENFDSTNLDTSNVTDMSEMFTYCNSLTSLIGTHTLEEVEAGTVVALKGTKTTFEINYCEQLDRASLLAVINGLATVSSTTTLTLGSTLLAKLTDDDKKIATDKGWTLV